MEFFSNSNVNLLNLHRGIRQFENWIVFVFGAIYLYQNGYQLYQVLLIIAGMNLLRMVLRPTFFPLGRVLGIRNLLILSSCSKCMSSLVLTQIHTSFWWIAVYMFLQAWSSALYWTSFHILFTVSGNAEHRGKQVAVGQALIIIISALVPYLSALFIDTKGFIFYFLFSIPVMVLSALPLIFCRIDESSINFKKPLWRDMYKSIGAHIQGSQCGMYGNYDVCWRFIVFFALGDMVDFGEILTLSLLVQACLQFAIGHYVDKGHGASILRIGVFFAGFAFLMMAFLPVTYWVVLLVEIIFGFANINNGLLVGHALYNAGKESRSSVEYWVGAENFADISHIVMYGGAILLLLAGVSLNHIMLLCLLSLGVFYIVIRSYQKDSRRFVFMS